MDYNGYLARLKAIHNDCTIKAQALAKEYAFSHSDIKVGDLITDHFGKIKVEVIKFSIGDVPSCVYTGPMYTKAGKPMKSGKSRSVWQRNLAI